MQRLIDLVTNLALWCALCGWFVAQFLKVPIYLVTDHKWDWSRFRGSGGMPSSHTSLCVALTTYIGFTEGFGSTLFVVSLATASIVMYDASHVRRETGKQSAVINEILRNVLVNGQQISEDNLKELVGHRPIEVLGGAILGIIIGAVFALIKLH